MKASIALLTLSFGMAGVFAEEFQVQIQPVPAALVQDSNTTFLVNLTTVKTQADFAAGNSQLTVNTNNFVPGVGLQGTVGFTTAGNFDTNAWTVEMIIKLPYISSSLDLIELASWTNNNPYNTFELALSRAVGVQTRIYCNDVNFYVQPHAGGNHRTIQESATDKWVYVAFGCDFNGQQVMAAAREVNGDILNQDVLFIPTPQVLGTNWLGGRDSIAQYRPATFTLGNAAAGLQIQAIRLSNIYRSNIFQVVPVFPQANATNWVPQSLDPARAQIQSVNRNVGYPGYNNFVPMLVNESYLPLAPGDAPLSISLTNMPVGLYTFYLYGAVDPKGRPNLNRVWQPCPLDFEAHDTGGATIARGRMLLKQSFLPRRMQGFHFHVDQPGNVTATFRIPTNGMETAWLQQIILVDQLAGFPDVAVKTKQNLGIGFSNQLSTLTVARTQRDDAIWNTLPPLNTHLQVNGTVPQFETPPTGAAVDTWITPAFQNLELYQQPPHTFDPLDFLDTNNGTLFPQDLILAGEPWPGLFPDAGQGVFFRKTDFPALATDIYNTKRAELLGYRYLLFAGALMNSRGSLYGLDLPLQYFSGGDPNIGHDGAIALVRWAYDWPALEMSLHEIRLCTHSPDFESGIDWSSEFSVRNGKMLYTGFSGAETVWLFEAYDQLFPYIAGNQVFANAVHRFIPWVNTPQDVIRLLDRYLVYSSVRDVKRGLIDGSSGVEDTAAQVLGPSPLTASFFDLTKQFADIYPITGPYQELYGTAMSRSGVYYVGSYLVYAFGSALDLINKANLIKQAKQAGVVLPMDLSDVSKFPKVRSAGSFLLDMWVAGGFPFMVGDSSGGTHSGLEATFRIKTFAANAISNAFDLYGDPRHAWVMKNLLGNTNSSVAAASIGVKDPVLQAVSRVVPDYGAILEMTPDEFNPLKKTAATLRLGVGSGHVHHDFLDLNLFAMGLPLAVDLACRNEQNNWSRPGANFSFLHNHALAHDSIDPNGAGAQSGEPWLRAFAPPLLRASYVDQSGTNALDRDVVLMEVGNGTGTFYAFDVQRLRGGIYHTWAFHGCESDALQLNVPMQPQTNRWTDRLLEGTQMLGPSTNTLQATWTMTRQTTNFTYAFFGGGTLTTVACEPTVLGPAYNAARQLVNVRATLLGRGTDTVMQGNPYSDAYSYCFPFLWAQSSNEVESVYPAVYEWYRGNTAIVANAELLQSSPLQVRVTTTSGQVDSFEVTSNYFLAVSRDTNGVRWVKLSGSNTVNVAGLSLTPAGNYDATIVDLDYITRTLTTSVPLPANPGVTAGNSGRQIFLQLSGTNTSFSWADDLLVQEGQITSLHVAGSNSVLLASDQQVLFDGQGNRSSAAMTVTTEDRQWHFRGGNVIKSPVGVPLTLGVFSDANGDGLINMKTYEIGIGDHLTLPVDITIQRVSGGWRIKTNVPFTGTVNATPLSFSPSSGWQDVDNAGVVRLSPASDFRLLQAK